MYPIRLSLLSPQKKKHLKKMANFQFLKNMFEIILIITSIVAMVILGSQTILQQHFINITENIISISNQHVDTSRTIGKINKLLQDTSNIQKSYISWPSMVLEVASSTPDNVILSHLSMDDVEKKVSIAGQAKTRNSFLEFEQNLKKLEFIENIQSPLSGLTQKEDVSFTITADLK